MALDLLKTAKYFTPSDFSRMNNDIGNFTVEDDQFIFKIKAPFDFDVSDVVKKYGELSVSKLENGCAQYTLRFHKETIAAMAMRITVGFTGGIQEYIIHKTKIRIVPYVLLFLSIFMEVISLNYGLYFNAIVMLFPICLNWYNVNKMHRDREDMFKKLQVL